MEGIKHRLKIVYIDLDLLCDLLCQDGTKKYVIEGMPKDIRVVAVSDFVFDKNEVAFRVESKEFTEVSRGCPIPELKLVVKKLGSACEKLDILKY